ncbi:hypothetical protein G6F59_016087 [Rhizopus arrhizus]|nr:hypothetical protein G6F59_016087 [Rhizopus arrhizus]
MQRHVRAARGLLGGGNREFALAVRFPLDRVRGTGAAAHHRDLVRHDERRIEAHAELADQLRILLLVAGQLAQEVTGAGLGDGAEVGDAVEPVAQGVEEGEHPPIIAARAARDKKRRPSITAAQNRSSSSEHSSRRPGPWPSRRTRNPGWRRCAVPAGWSGHAGPPAPSAAAARSH